MRSTTGIPASTPGERATIGACAHGVTGNGRNRGDVADLAQIFREQPARSRCPRIAARARQIDPELRASLPDLPSPRRRPGGTRFAASWRVTLSLPIGQLWSVLCLQPLDRLRFEHCGSDQGFRDDDRELDQALHITTLSNRSGSRDRLAHQRRGATRQEHQSARSWSDRS